MNQNEITNIVTTAPDLSIIGLITGADIIVKLILLLLAGASLWSWSIIIDKSILINRISSKTTKFEKIFWSGQLLEQLFARLKNKADHPLALVFVAAMDEFSKHHRIGNMTQGTLTFLNISLKDRIFQAMEMVKNKEIDTIEKNLSFLAIVGSSSTFVGLFGTVWGIMNSFQSIATAKNASIAVVAPGIAEALFATAVGLVVAIPAMVSYNLLAAKVNHIANKIENFANELGSLLSQEIDRGVNNGNGTN